MGGDPARLGRVFRSQPVGVDAARFRLVRGVGGGSTVRPTAREACGSSRSGGARNWRGRALYLGRHPRGPLGVRSLRFVSTGEAEYEETCPDYLNLLCLPGEEAASAAGRLARSVACPGTASGSSTCPRLAAVPRSRGGSGAAGGLPNRRAGPGIRGLPLMSVGQDPPACPPVSPCGRPLRGQFRISDGGGGRLLLRRLSPAPSGAVDGGWEIGLLLYAAIHRVPPRPRPRLGTVRRAILARLSHNGTAYAVIYGFITRSKFDGYQSGISRSDSCPIDSPGTTAHLLLMKALIDRGITEYDFLRGNSSYKERLATRSDPLVGLAVSRPTFRTAVHRTVRFAGRAPRKTIRPRGSRQEEGLGS